MVLMMRVLAAWMYGLKLGERVVFPGTADVIRRHYESAANRLEVHPPLPQH